MPCQTHSFGMQKAEATTETTAPDLKQSQGERIVQLKADKPAERLNIEENTKLVGALEMMTKMISRYVYQENQDCCQTLNIDRQIGGLFGFYAVSVIFQPCTGGLDIERTKTFISVLTSCGLQVVLAFHYVLKDLLVMHKTHI